jgi:hypothetical protein
MSIHQLATLAVTILIGHVVVHENDKYSYSQPLTYCCSITVSIFFQISAFYSVWQTLLYRYLNMSNTSNGNGAADPYRLNRDIVASMRLNLQHYIWKENMGYILHPSIELPSTGVRIADVGTGTGYYSQNINVTCTDSTYPEFGLTTYPASTPMPRSTAWIYPANSILQRDSFQKMCILIFWIFSRRFQPSMWRSTM